MMPVSAAPFDPQNLPHMPPVTAELCFPLITLISNICVTKYFHNTVSEKKIFLNHGKSALVRNYIAR
jgi:hypothetical protein